MIWILLLPIVGRAEERSGWSADLLSQILKTENARPARAGVTSTAESGAETEVMLRTYHLTHLRIGEAGKSQNVLAILEKLLPPGSSMNSDVPANSVHVLTTARVHAAIWDYLSAVDVADVAPSAPVAAIPDDVRAALQKVADAGEQSAKLFKAIEGVKSGMAGEIARIESRRQAELRILLGTGALVLLASVVIGFRLLRRPAQPVAPPVTTATPLAIAPDQIATALLPAQDRMRNDMLGLLNEVAIKLQAQHHDQQKLVQQQQLQLDQARHALAAERKQFIDEAGSMVVQAVERVDATTAKLARQQDKVAELVEELQSTVRELDETKDHLRTREIELEQERAKIAALSLLLEEGGALPPQEVIRMNGNRETGGGAGPARNGHRLDHLCTNPDQPKASQDQEPTPPATPRFRFLPPEHPET